MGWEIELRSEVESWFFTMVEDEPETADLIQEALNLLEEQGPRLGRPLVDKVKASRHHNMKELRPASAGRTEIRMLFAFDPHRKAIVLVAGDKAGNWQGWYRTNIPVADQRFDEHLAALTKKGKG